MGDDAVGCRIGELLSDIGVTDVVDCGTTPENYVGALRASPPPSLLIVDAADMGLRPGEVRRLSLGELNSASMSSHGIPMSLLLSPFEGCFEISALGIQPSESRLGAPLSPEIEKTALYVAKAIESGEWENIDKLPGF
jgi:hydrogenase 3 maturation protease